MAISRVLKEGLVPGPHPDELETWLVLEPEQGHVYELSELVWGVAEALDGRRTAGDLAGAFDVDVEDIEEIIRRLEGLHLLAEPPRTEPSVHAPPPEPQWRRAPVPAGYSIRVHPQVRFRCVSIGVCCEHGYVIPVAADQVDALRAAARARGEDRRDPVTFWPSAPGEPWGYALDNDDGCPFFDVARRCSIHGEPAQPHACRVFPLVYARVGEEILASVSYRCGCGAMDDGPLLSTRHEEIAQRLEASPHVPVVPERVRLDEERSLDGRDVVEILTSAAEARAPGRSAWGLLEAAIGGLLAVAEAEGAGPSTSGPRPGLAGLTRRLCAAATPELADLFSGQGPAPADTVQLRARLEEAGLRAVEGRPEHDGEAELARFVRDHLFGVRPLQQATLTHGLALLAVLIDGVTGRGFDAVVMRAHLMRWDDLIPQVEMRTALFEARHPLTQDAAALFEAIQGVARPVGS